MTYQIHQSQDGSILIGSRTGLSDISIEITGVGQKLALPVDGSKLNAEPIHRLPKGSSLSFDVEDNEGNVEPQVSSWGSTPHSATAALGQDKGLASPSAPLSQDEGSASHRPTEDGRGNDEAEEECGGEPEEFEPQPGSESAIEHIRLQLWDRRPVRGTPFRAKAEIRINRRPITGFINFTESRKWYGKRQDTEAETQFWYEFYRGIASEFEQGYDGDTDYRPRIGHMIKRPEWGKKEEQIPQAGGILRWQDGQPRITLLINDYTFPMTMEKSKHKPRLKTPGWYAYYQPKREEDDDEE